MVQDIAGLKRQVATLKRKVAQLEKALMAARGMDATDTYIRGYKDGRAHANDGGMN
jgi:hypothetical protein